MTDSARQTTNEDPAAAIESLMAQGGGETAFDAPGSPDDRVPGSKPKPVPASPETKTVPEDEEEPVSAVEEILSDLGLTEDKTAAEPEGGDGDQARSVDLEVIAAALGIEKDDLSLNESGQVLIRSKVDGENFTVSAEQLRKGYQLDQNYTRKSQALAEQQRTWEAQREQQARELTTRGQMVDQMLSAQEQALQGESQQVNWEELRRLDPAEFSAKQMEYQQRWNAIQVQKQQVAQAIQAEQQKMVSEKRDQMMQIRQQESTRLAEVLKWDTEEKRTQGTTQLRSYLTESGFTDSEIDTLYDHRVGHLIDKARQFDALMAKVGKARRKVAQVDKPIRGSQGRSGSRATEARLAKDVIDQHHRKQDLGTAAAAIESLGILD